VWVSLLSSALGVTRTWDLSAVMAVLVTFIPNMVIGSHGRARDPLCKTPPSTSVLVGAGILVYPKYPKDLAI
jgi:hypothetical protein